MRVRCGSVIVVVGVLVGVAGCSTGGGAPASGVSMSGAVVPAQPTAPPKALCDAARTLVAGAQPTFDADAEAPPAQQAADGSAFYTQLLLVFSENGGSDPLSVPVSQDAAALAKDYNGLQSAAQDRDLDAQVAVLKNLVTDLGALGRDQVGFDQACGIPSIEHT